MSAEDIIAIIDAIPQYITFIYPGYITIYVYVFLRAKHIQDTKGIILKSVALSYIYSVLIDKMHCSSELHKNFILIVMAVLVAYIAYLTLKSEVMCDLFKGADIQTTMWDNEIDALKGFKESIWLTVYLKSENIVYEGSLHLKELEPGQRQYITLTSYRKYKLEESGFPHNPYIVDLDDNEEEVMIFYEDIKRIEKRKTE